MKLRRGVKQFIKFGVVGASGAGVNFVLYHVCLHFFVPKWLAFAIGFLVGGVNNYWWNRHWTFRSKGHPLKEFLQFITVSVVALAISEPVLLLAEHYLPPMPLRNSVIWLIATTAGMCWNFFVNKFWTFRHTHHAVPEKTS